MATEKTFSNNCLQLHRGDMIYMASDGYQDQFGGAKDKKFMRPNFRELLSSISQEPTPRQNQKVQEVFEHWRGGQVQTDDVLLLGVRV